MCEQSCADGGDLGACDGGFFLRADGLVETPAVEVGAVERRADAEVRPERRDNPLEWVQVRAMLTDEVSCIGVLRRSEGLPLLQPPPGSTLVEGGNIELVQHEPPARLQQMCEVTE
jgi:hypothetical protein